MILLAQWACGPPPKPLEVYAAASTTDVMAALELAYESKHPDVDVRVTLAGSHLLDLQIRQGAQPDVFVSADVSRVASLGTFGFGETTSLATNELVVVSQEPLASIKDLAAVRRIGIGDPHVPVGIHTERWLNAAETSLSPNFVAAVRERVVTVESNVRLLRTKVQLGAVDAAFVYRSDVLPKMAVTSLEMPASDPPRVVGASRTPDGASFLAYAASSSGRAAFREHGFQP